jgi:hypothetical protein
MALQIITQAAQAVHKLKHKVSILGLEKSYYLSDYEDNLNDNSSLEKRNLN